MSSKSESPFLKESLGFAEGVDVEIYLVDSRGGEARHIGALRPDYSTGISRLYHLVELRLESPETQSVYFGQRDKKPHIIRLVKKDESEFRGEIETDLFIAVAEMIMYSPYEKERFTLTLEVKKNVKSMDRVLPDAWLSTDEESE